MGAPQTSMGELPTSMGALPTSTGASQSSMGAPQSSMGAPPTSARAPQTSMGAPQASMAGHPIEIAAPRSSLGGCPMKHARSPTEVSGALAHFVWNGSPMCLSPRRILVIAGARRAALVATADERLGLAGRHALRLRDMTMRASTVGRVAHNPPSCRHHTEAASRCVWQFARLTPSYLNRPPTYGSIGTRERVE
jgi:hypothetical protein